MIEKIGTIKNPLTVIAIFAAIAEISGTLVLPFISPEHQGAYIWFLMLFPVLLVAAFFLTLNFNHAVLYAPSDYQQEEHFLRAFEKLTPKEQIDKLKAELRDALEQQPQSSRVVLKTEPEQIQQVSQDLIRKVSSAERLVLNKLSSELGKEIKTNVRIWVSDRQAVVFDGVASNGNAVEVVEVKLLRGEKIPRDRFDFVFSHAEIVATKLAKDGNRRLRFRLIFAVVLDDRTINLANVEKQLREVVKQYDIEADIRVYYLEDLEQQIETKP